MLMFPFQVIVTSYLFPSAKFDLDRLRRLAEQVEKKRLVVDVRSVQTIMPTLLQDRADELMNEIVVVNEIHVGL
jgi:hypothetical protein